MMTCSNGVATISGFDDLVCNVSASNGGGGVAIGSHCEDLRRNGGSTATVGSAYFFCCLSILCSLCRTDSISTAQSTGNENCGHLYGCCADGITPAQGPNGQGCAPTTTTTPSTATGMPGANTACATYFTSSVCFPAPIILTQLK